MKLLARAYIVSDKKPHHRHYHTVSEWEWHISHRFFPLSLDNAMYLSTHLIPFLLDNGATSCSRDHKNRIIQLRDELYTYRHYDTISIILSHPHFCDELRTKSYNFRYPFDDIDGLRVLVKHGHKFRSRDIANALLCKSYKSALYMCDYTCDNLWDNENSIDIIDRHLYNMINNSDKEEIQNIGCEISKKIFPKSGHHL